MNSFFTKTILDRGKDYFKKNRVFSIQQINDKRYSGIVLGNETYHVKIDLDEHYNIKSATCDCPYAKDGKHCKHEAALYFAIEDRLPKEDSQYIDINAIIKRVSKRTRNYYYMKCEVDSELRNYIDRLIRFNDQGNLDITQFQKVIEEFLNSYFPQEYRYETLQTIVEGYAELLTNDDNKSSTTKWLKECMKYRQYDSLFNYIEPVILKLDVQDQLNIIKEILLHKKNPTLLNTYFKVINDNHLDVKDYLKDIEIYNQNEQYIMEMLQYYINQQNTEQAYLYYKEHEKNIKTKETKAKLQSWFEPGREDAYLQYVKSRIYYDNISELLDYYDGLKQFYGIKFDKYLIEFMDHVMSISDDYNIVHLFKVNQDTKYLIYTLLHRPKFTIFEQTQKMIKEYSLEMYILVYVECLKEYMRYNRSIFYIRDYVNGLFVYLDDTARIEFVDMIKKEYPRRKMIIEFLDECLEEGEIIEI